MSAPTPNPWISRIDAYVPGSSKGVGGRTPVKLSSNENPWGASPAAIEAVRRTAAGANRYPDSTAAGLRAALGRLHGIPPERIVCGTGSDEILQLLPLIYCQPGDSVIHVRHGFMVYPIAARRAGAEPIAAPDSAYTADVDAMLAAVRADTRVVFIANPNNPTGTMISAAEMARLHKGLRDDILLVIDQAYAEYLDSADPDGGLLLAAQYENVVVTRTFSKIYGLGGLRIGWATGHPALIAELNRVRAPFPIAATSLAAAEAALADQDFVRQCRARNKVGRAKIEAAIAASGNKGFAVVPSSANFVLFLCPPEGPLRAEALYQALYREGFITRWLPGLGLGHALRVSVGTEEETDAFLAAFRRIVDRA